VKHHWRSIDGPRLGLDYVPHAWGYSCCERCRVVRFYHDSGPKGGTYVTYTWPRGHHAALPGIPRQYITRPVYQKALIPPCLHVVPLPRVA